MVHGTVLLPFDCPRLGAKKVNRKYVCVLVTQSCLTLCDPVDCSLSGSSVHGILQARILDCVASPPGELPDLEIKSMSPASPALQVDSLPTEPSGKPII